MAFSHTIDPTAPSGGSLLSNGDDAVRELAAAVLERLTSAFQDPDVDPMLVKNGSISKDQLSTATNLRSILRAQYNIVETIVSNGTTSWTIGVVGAALGDHVSVCWVTAPGDVAALGIIFGAYVSSADVVTVHAYNITGANRTLNDAIDIAVIKTTMTS